MFWRLFSQLNDKVNKFGQVLQFGGKVERDGLK